MARRVIDNHGVPVQGLQHLGATGIHVMLASNPAKILAAYLSPTRPNRSDLSACLGGGLPVLMAGDLNAKHVEWNSRLITKRGRLLRDYADNNSCLIYERNTRTLLIPWCRVLLEKLTGLQLYKKFPAFYGTRRFITAFTSFRHPSLSWASPIPSPCPSPPPGDPS